MRNIDDSKFFINNNNYSDINAKVDYLINKYGFKIHPLNETMMFKNDLIIYIDSLYNYSLEKLDVINFLARKRFVHDPFWIKGYVNEFLQLKYEDIHNFEPREIKEMYQIAREKFYEKVVLQ